MIKANHRKWAEIFFEKYLNSLFNKSFSSLNLIGEVPEVKNETQLIVLPNHSTWWDGFFVWYLNKHFFKRKFYIMMLESRLRKYKFFTKLGAFSMNRDSPKSIIETFNYINEILSSSDKMLLNFYPQGELLPNSIRPITINPGIIKIIKNFKGELAILPLGMKPEFLGERLPTVFFNFGKLIYPVSKNENLEQVIRNSIEYCLESISSGIINKKFGKVLLRGKKSPT